VGLSGHVRRFSSESLGMSVCMEQRGVADSRPALAVPDADAEAAAREFATGLQAGHDQRDADVLNRQFARDVAWGSPYGALVEGYDTLHSIHVRFQDRKGTQPRVRYEVRRAEAVSADVVVAHIARLILGSDDDVLPPNTEDGQPFSELALYVLVRRQGHWWLAAGQNTPMRPGGAVPATAS
jgi:uncharacterized protein (TIGR02246 family)